MTKRIDLRDQDQDQREYDDDQHRVCDILRDQHLRQSAEDLCSQGTGNLCHQTEDAERSQLHDHIDDLDHQVVAGFKQVDHEGLGFACGQQGNADTCDDGEDDDLDDREVRHGAEYVIRHIVDDTIQKADALGRILLCSISQRNADARLDNVGEDDTGAGCQERSDDPVDNEPDTDAFQLAQVCDTGDTADDRADDQRKDRHLQQTDEDRSDRIGHVRPVIMRSFKDKAEYKAQCHADQDHIGKAHFLFLHGC